MEREVGEIFEFEDKKLQAVESTGITCKRCYFYKSIGSCTLGEISNFIGNCISYSRKDKKNVFFKEVKSMKQTIEIEVPDGKKAVWRDGKVIFEDITPKLPKTWEEFCKQNEEKENEYYISNCCFIMESLGNRQKDTDRNVLPNKQAAKQHLALMQLHQLRDLYRQGWEPNYSDDSQKVNIEKRGDTPMIVISIRRSSFLSFPTQELAEQFLTNFRNLIEQAGDLI